MMGFGFLVMLLVFALPIVGIVVLVIWLSNANRQGNRPKNGSKPQVQA